MRICILFFFLFPFTSLFSHAETAFYRAVSIGGDSLEIRGNRWEGDSAGGFSCRDRQLVLKDRLSLVPEADDSLTAALLSYPGFSGIADAPVRIVFSDNPVFHWAKMVRFMYPLN